MCYTVIYAIFSIFSMFDKSLKGIVIYEDKVASQKYKIKFDILPINWLENVGLAK